MEEEEDLRESMIKSAKPTPSQEAILSNCPLARASESFSPGEFSSSFSLTPSEPTGIAMISPPKCSASISQRHSQSPLFSREDKNPNGSCRTTKMKVSEAGLRAAKRGKVAPGEDDVVEIQNTECGAGRRPSLKAKGEVVELSGFLELLNEAKGLLQDAEAECEEEDIMEIAKKCGWRFPRPRWWPAEGEDWSV